MNGPFPCRILAVETFQGLRIDLFNQDLLNNKDRHSFMQAGELIGESSKFCSCFAILSYKTRTKLHDSPTNSSACAGHGYLKDLGLIYVLSAELTFVILKLAVSL